MVISSFYNKEDNVLMLTTIKDQTSTEIVCKDKVVKIYNGDKELIAVNILDYKKDLNQGVVDFELVYDEIKKYFGEDVSAPYIVGEIISLKKHPKSDKLNICQVNLGNRQEQIVCGASNVSEGIKVIVSVVGAVMPMGLKIKKSKLLDEKSNGMITSYKELGLNQETSGIAILDNSFEVGSNYKIAK